MGQKNTNQIDSLGNRIGYWEECEYIDYWGETEVNDTICVKGNYNNGDRDSLWLLFSKTTGVIRMEVEYIDLVKIAYSEYDNKGNKIVYHYLNPFDNVTKICFYYPNGAIEDSVYEDSTIRFKISYHKNGQIHRTYMALDSVKTYRDYKYWDNGNLWEEINFIHNGDMKGIEHGKTRTYHPNGKIHVDCNYYNGLLDKLYIQHNTEGEPIKYKFYDRGKMIYSGSELPLEIMTK